MRKPMNDDAELLRCYVEDRSEAAFGELVQRHLSLVYFAALRRTGGDAHLAEDIAQGVFTALAREAGALSRHTALPGWLYTATRFTAAKALRAARRRQTREQEAHLMHELYADPGASDDWEKLRPVLDDALDALNARDREAVLLRFFADLPLAEIGARLNVTEDAARMRVDRALEKLHALLARRGVTSTAAALAVALANQAAATAPAGLAATVTGAALAGAAAAAGGAASFAQIFNFMSTTKIALSVAGALAVGATLLTLQQQRANVTLRAEIAAMREQTTAEVATLREENRRLQGEKAGVEDSARAEHTELVRLREAREAFRKALAARQATATRPGDGPAAENSGLAPGMISMDLMANAGRATPSATAQTIAWALRQADFKVVASALTFDAPERAKLEAFIATLPDKIRTEYGTPEEVVALVMAGSPKPIAGVQLLNRTQPDADTEIQVVQWQYQTGEVQQNELKFHRDADGWKQVVSPALTDRVIAFLKPKQ